MFKWTLLLTLFFRGQKGWFIYHVCSFSTIPLSIPLFTTNDNSTFYSSGHLVQVMDLDLWLLTSALMIQGQLQPFLLSGPLVCQAFTSQQRHWLDRESVNIYALLTFSTCFWLRLCSALFASTPTWMLNSSVCRSHPYIGHGCRQSTQCRTLLVNKATVPWPLVSSLYDKATLQADHVLFEVVQSQYPGRPREQASQSGTSL